MSQNDKSDSEQRLLKQLEESQCVPQQLVFQRVRLTYMSAIKKANGLLEDRLRRRVMRNADLSRIMWHIHVSY